MIKRVLAVAVATGLVVGAIMALVLQVTTTPLILKAESYEKAAQATEGKSVLLAAQRPGTVILRVHGDGHLPPSAVQHDDSGWQPTDGLQRTAVTSVATVAAATAYALLLLGCMIVARERIDAGNGLLWGLAGFAAVGLAPALGLAPELPGSAAGDLLMRQLWWAATAVATAGGLFLLFRRPQPSAKAAGVALVLAPHLVGAPQPLGFESTAPAELAASFAATSLVVHALLWCLVGWGVGVAWSRTARNVPPGVGAPA